MQWLGESGHHCDVMRFFARERGRSTCRPRLWTDGGGLDQAQRRDENVKACRRGTETGPHFNRIWNLALLRGAAALLYKCDRETSYPVLRNLALLSSSPGSETVFGLKSHTALVDRRDSLHLSFSYYP